MTITQAINKAIEGGWKYPIWFEDVYSSVHATTEIADELLTRYVLLDPLFWLALGRAIEHGKKAYMPDVWDKLSASSKDSVFKTSIEYEWHCLIDHLASGGSIESFFETL